MCGSVLMEGTHLTFTRNSVGSSPKHAKLIASYKMDAAQMLL